MIAPPTSWMMLPPGLMALSPALRRARAACRPSPRSSSAKVFSACVAWLISCVRPFPVEAQHRDAELVLHRRIEIGVAVFVGNHFAAPGEVDERAVIAARVLLEFAAVTAAGEPSSPDAVPSRACAGRRRIRCDSRGRNRASRRSAPCRATRARRSGRRRRRPRCAAAGSRAAGPGRRSPAPTVSMMYLPTRPLELRRTAGVQQDAHRLERAGREHDHARLARGARRRSWSM